MADFRYPGGDIDQPTKIALHYGSTWTSAFQGSDQIDTLALSRGRVAFQQHLDLQEAINTVSRLTSPVFHLEQWYSLLLRESDLNSETVAVLRYGENGVYGGPHKYGVPFSTRFIFPLDSEIREVPYIFNRITEPSVTLIHGLDYSLDAIDQAIVFRENPFTNPLIPKRDVFERGEVVDRELILWLFRAQIERDHIYKHLGYVVGVRLPSSLPYRDYANAIWDGAVEGAASKQIEDAVAALTDTPITREATETIRHVLKDNRHLLVVTDKHVYRYPRGASAVVSVGDTVHAGDQLVDTVAFYEFRNGDVPADLLALELDAGFLTPGFLSGLTFENKEVPLVVDTSGMFTKVEFEIGGWPGDIEKFWDDFHERGIADPPTLAQLLDQRTNKMGEPTAAALPSKINPLEFLAQNVLRNHVFVVKVKVSQLGEGALPFVNARHLHKLVPPHTEMILVAELAVDEEVITMEGPGTDDEPGFEEDPSLAYGVEVDTETIDATFLIEDGEPKLSYAEGVCI